MSEHVLIERRGAVQVIRLNRPEKKNAITRAMYAAMAEALKAGDTDEAVRCHVLLGQPGAFSAGNDLADFMASGVDGIAVGIGTTIHMHCDLTLATPKTVFSTPFVDLGLVPEAGSSLLGPAIMGHQRAFAMLAMAEGLPAEEAQAAGLIHRVVGEGELESAVFKAAEALAAKPPEALRIARNLLRGPRDDVVARIREEGEHFRARLKSDEARAAFMAFMSRK